MRVMSILDNLHCKMQAHAKMCKENKESEGKMTGPLKCLDERSTFKGFRRRMS